MYFLFGGLVLTRFICLLSLTIFSNPAVRMVRKSFKDINRTGQLQEDKTLIV